MKNLSTFKKKKKMSMKYFLRKDYVSNFLNQTESENQLFQLYIEFIFKTKANKCKSVWKEFIQKDSHLSKILASEFQSERLGYSFYGVSSKIFTTEIQKNINGKASLQPQKNDDFMNALIYEKYHAEALFDLIRELDGDKFSMSKFGSEYKNSVIFVFPFFEIVLKKMLLEKFYLLYHNFPKILSVDTTLEVLSLGLSEIIYNFKNQGNDDAIHSFRNYCLFSIKIFNIIQEYICFSDNFSSANGITLPVWFVENHSEKLINYVEKNATYFTNEEKDLLRLLIQNTDNQLLAEKNNLLRKFV